MHRRGLCRPSLKITRSGDHMKADRFCIEIWKPFRHEYQLINSVEEDMARVNDLGQMFA